MWDATQEFLESRRSRCSAERKASSSALRHASKLIHAFLREIAFTIMIPHIIAAHRYVDITLVMKKCSVYVLVCLINKGIKRLDLYLRQYGYQTA